MNFIICFLCVILGLIIGLLFDGFSPFDDYYRYKIRMKELDKRMVETTIKLVETTMKLEEQMKGESNEKR